MLIEIAMFSDRSDEQKLLDALNIFYFRNIPKDINAAIERLQWFFRCGKEPLKPAGKGRARRAYCFEQDAPLIYAAFRAQYGINLQQTKNMDLHWWEFCALFDSLNEDLKISRVMYYRTADLSGMPKKQKEYIKKMRALYAIKNAEATMDSKVKLAKRNADMKAYVRKRSAETRKSGVV